METVEIDLFRKILLSQFRSCLSMLRSNINECPEEIWALSMWPDAQSDGRLSQYWYVIFHTLFWADLYLGGNDKEYQPPSPFTLDELDPVGIVPAEPFDRDTLLSYLVYVEKRSELILLVTSEKEFARICEFSWGFKIIYAELVVDCIRHIQEHSAQCSMFLGQITYASQEWVSLSN